MSKKKNFILFLHNRYSAKDNNFYLSLVKGKTTVAVDGGVRFFLKNKIVPDVIIGDFDSSPRIPRKLLRQSEILTYPSRKDKTDSHLAIELALERGARVIDICGAVTATEMDHTLSNIFLLDLVNKYARKSGKRIAVRIISPGFRIYLLDNNSISIEGRKGELVSILPLTDRLKVAFIGLEYPSPKRPISLGDSLTLRNRLKGRKGLIRVEGKAVVTHILT